MNSLILLGTAWGLTFVLTLTVVAILRAPLFAVLQFICGTDVGARFWTAYSSVMIVVGPIFTVSFAAIQTADLADFLRIVMVRLSLGLIGAMVVMGVSVYSVRPPKAETPATAPEEA